MSKANTTLTIEPDLLESAKSLRINMSQTLSEALRIKVGAIKGDIDDINEELLNMQINELRNNINKDTITLHGKLEQQNMIISRRKEKEEERVKLEKEALEKANSCFNCERPLGATEKKHMFTKGVVCHACLMSADGKTIREWSI